MTTPIAQEKAHEPYTYADYLKWDSPERYELILSNASFEPISINIIPSFSATSGSGVIST